MQSWNLSIFRYYKKNLEFKFFLLWVCVWAYVTYMWLPSEAKREYQIPRAGVSSDCEPPDMGARNGTGVLWRAESTVIATKPSLQHLELCFVFVYLETGPPCSLSWSGSSNVDQAVLDVD